MRRALRALYAHYRETGDILDRVLCDAGRTPAFDDAVAAREHWLEGVVATLESGWVPRSKAKAKLLAAALEHAVRFNTWRSLSRSGLEDGDAARAMVRFVRALARRQRHNRKA
jgi:phytoene/squalene synthetase